MSREEVIDAVKRTYSFVRPEYFYPVSDEKEVAEEMAQVLAWIRSAQEPAAS